jgi:hypothetical protein
MTVQDAHAFLKLERVEKQTSTRDRIHESLPSNHDNRRAGVRQQASEVTTYRPGPYDRYPWQGSGGSLSASKALPIPNSDRRRG